MEKKVLEGTTTAAVGQQVADFLTTKGEEGATLAEINEGLGLSLKPGSRTALKHKGLIASKPEKRVIVTMVKRPINVYHFTSESFDELLPKAKTEKEINLLGAGRDAGLLAAGCSFTLEDFRKVTKRSSDDVTTGSFVGLVKKGILEQGEEKVRVDRPYKKKVSVYVAVATH